QPATPADVWYLVYRDENNAPHTVKGSTEGIRKALRERLLGDPSGIVVSRTKNGQFVPLNSTPEFRDLVVTPTPMPLPGSDPNMTSALGEAPPVSGGNRGGRPPMPPSGRYAPVPPPPSGTTPRQPSSGSKVRSAEASGGHEEGTVQYDYGKTPVSQQTPTPG